MNTVVIDAPTLSKLLAAGGVAEVRNEDGVVVGSFIPHPAMGPGLPRIPGLLPGTLTIVDDDDFTDFEGAPK
ncbi:MAG: hypothetical protein K2X82_13750 [Gemmataceae bacterium]|nr:hypothetical protein [Gemmataceae bacterium]